MNRNKIIIDTGPIVAYLNKKDSYHSWAVAQFASIDPPLYTCEAVLSEVCFLLRHFEKGVKGVFELLERDLIKIPFQLGDEFRALSGLLSKYKNVPISLADACLVRLSEQISDSVIFTLDSDFKIYRKHKRSVIPLIIPDQNYRNRL